MFAVIGLVELAEFFFLLSLGTGFGFSLLVFPFFFESFFFFLLFFSGKFSLLTLLGVARLILFSALGRGCDRGDYNNDRDTDEQPCESGGKIVR